MNREYHKWFSQRLSRDMELLIFGHGGHPLLVFPTSMGKFFEYEDRGMVHALAGPIAAGELTLFCVDSVDAESWYSKGTHPGARVQRHDQFDGYVFNEVVPLMRQRTGRQRAGVTGSSFGGYHAVNFALRHPDTVSHCVSMSGAYDIGGLLDGYYDELSYFHSPVDYLPQLGDPWYLDQFRDGIRWVFAAGEHDVSLDESRRIAAIFESKNIPHWLDVWGAGAGHGWPLWQQMAYKYFH